MVNADRKRFPVAEAACGRKNGAAVAGGSKVNREASNRVDRSHSMSKMDAYSNEGESLISR
jgi:hypothetical protein